MIAIADYGMGNLRSVEKALARVGAEPLRTGDPEAIAGAEGAVLPGVGAFGEAMRRIEERGLAASFRDRAQRGAPTLGICLGLQLLFESSEEAPGVAGLGLVAGTVRRLDAPGLKVPHIGWAPMRWEQGSPLASGLRGEPAFYFVHAYVPVCAEPGDRLGTAVYGERFTCAVQRGALWGVQFHPEKSSAAGLALLASFARACAPVPAGR